MGYVLCSAGRGPSIAFTRYGLVRHCFSSDVQRKRKEMRIRFFLSQLHSHFMVAADGSMGHKNEVPNSPIKDRNPTFNL